MPTVCRAACWQDMPGVLLDQPGTGCDIAGHVLILREKTPLLLVTRAQLS